MTKEQFDMQYKMLMDMSERIAKLETILGERCHNHQRQITLIDNRVTIIEQHEQFRRGVIAVITLIGGVVGAVATKVISSFIGQG